MDIGVPSISILRDPFIFSGSQQKPQGKQPVFENKDG